MSRKPLGTFVWDPVAGSLVVRPPDEVAPDLGHIVTQGDDVWAIEREAARGQLKLHPLNESGSSRFVMPEDLEPMGRAGGDNGPLRWELRGGR